jgi:hypothetical protein
MYKKINSIQGYLILAFLPLFLILAGYKMADTNEIKQKGFVPIFDGKTLNGWEGDPAYWRVENGHIVGEITPATLLKRNSFLIWRGGMPADFELTLEFKISQAGNSGINYRSEELKDIPFALKGYQLDIDGANRYTGQNYEERGRTTLAYRGQKTTIKAQNPENTGGTFQSKIKNNAWTDLSVTGSLGESDVLLKKINSEDWNTCRLVAKGNRLQHYINGILMSDVTDNDKVNGKSKGMLGMQVHVGPPMKVEYRKIMLKQ